MEPFPEERENFLQQLYKFMEDRGEPSHDFYTLKDPRAGLAAALSAFSACFLTLAAFTSTGTPINKRPVLGYRNLNLFKLYRLVHKLGGFDNVSELLWVRLAAVTLVSVRVR